MNFVKFLLFPLSVTALAACQSSAGSSASMAEVSTPAAAQTTPASNGTGWPRFRGPNGDGISTETGLNLNWSTKSPKLLWKTSLTDGGYAGPALVGGVVYIVDHQGSDDFVRALKATDGSELWRYTYPDASDSNYGFARSTPAIDSGKVYVVSRLGKVLCLNATNGKLLWQRDMVAEFGGQRPGWDYAASPVITGNQLIVLPGGQNAAIAALDKATGKTLWQGPGGQASYATPVLATIAGVKQYVIMLQKGVAGFDASNGKPLWSVPWETSYDVNAASPIVVGNNVFVSSGYGHGCAMISVKSGGASIAWQNRSIQAHFSTAIYYKGYLYGTGDPGVLVCLDPKTGSTLWKQPGFEKGGMVGVEGKALVQNGQNGDLVLVNLTTSGYQELGRIAPLRGQSWTAPIIGEGKAVVRTPTELAVIDLS